ncbi:MAG: FAD:protein FMN transferase [Bacilli bacterium]
MKNRKSILILAIVILVLAGLLFKIERNYKITKLSYFEYFDTFIEVSIYDEVKDKKAIDKLVDEKIKSINDNTDAFLQHLDNDLYSLNRDGVVKNQELAWLIQYGTNSYNTYSNQYNLALGPVIDIWKTALSECNDNNNCQVPDLSGIDTTRLDPNLIDINEDKITIENGMKIDLGGIVKGYCTDEIADLLKDEGYNHFLINAGGNIYGSTKPNDESYIISVVNPINNQESFIKFSVSNKSVVTSGDYERYFEVDNKRYSHLINSDTLYPSTYYHSVTVISDKSIDGDILSTMLFGLEYKKGLQIVEELDGVEAVWFDKSGEILKSSGISDYEKK